MVKQPDLQDGTTEFHGSSRLTKVIRSSNECKNSKPRSPAKSSSSVYSSGGGASSPCKVAGTRRGLTSRPVITHMFEPEVIIVEPEEFMSVVQKLTGLPNTSRSRLPSSAGCESRRSVQVQEYFSRVQPGRPTDDFPTGKHGLLLPSDPSSPPSSLSSDSVGVHPNSPVFSSNNPKYTCNCNPHSCNIVNSPRDTPLLCSPSNDCTTSENFATVDYYYYRVKPSLCMDKNVKHVPSSPNMSPKGDCTDDISTGYTSHGGSSGVLMDEGQADIELVEEVNFFVFSLDSYYGTRVAPQGHDWQEP